MTGARDLGHAVAELGDDAADDTLCHMPGRIIGLVMPIMIILSLREWVSVWARSIFVARRVHRLSSHKGEAGLSSMCSRLTVAFWKHAASNWFYTCTVPYCTCSSHPLLL